MVALPRLLLLLLAPLALSRPAHAQSPTLPSDTLEANYAPPNLPGPMPELAPSLPSDTLTPGAPLVPPDSAAGMRRDWDQEEDAGEPWKTEDDDDADARLEALQFKLG